MNGLTNFSFNFPMVDSDSYQINEVGDRTLRELFKGKINGSFLIKIKCIVVNTIGTKIFNYYPIQLDNASIVTGTDDAPLYDICRMIVGVHRSHSIFLSKEKIRLNEKDSNYQNIIVSEVIEKIKLRKYGSSFYRKRPLNIGDEFLYYPVPYNLFVMCIKSIGLLINNHEDPLAAIYYGIVNNALSALSLMENNFLNNAYPLCRGMIELYMKALALQKYPDAFGDYIKFNTFEIEQSCCSQEYSAEFRVLYNKRRLQTAKSKVDYLHYGWLDSIDSYDCMCKNRYSIYGLFDFLEDVDIKNIKKLYKMCHGYAHGSVIQVKYPLLQYFEISMMIYYVVKDVFMKVSDESIIDDQNIIEMINRDFGILHEQYKIRSTNNFELYYQ